MTMKVVINTCWGGFGLSSKALREYYRMKEGGTLYAYRVDYDAKKKESKYIRMSDSKPDNYACHSTADLGPVVREIPNENYYYPVIDRSDEVLIQIVEYMGAEAGGSASSLKVVEIPDGVDYYIHDYDGMESIHEQHRQWS